MCGATPLLPLYTFMAWTATPYLYHTIYISYGEGFKIPTIVHVGFLEKTITLNRQNELIPITLSINLM